MTQQTDSPFTVRPDPAKAAAPTVAIATYSYAAFRTALKRQVDRLGGHLAGIQTSVEGLEQEDLAFNEEGEYDEDFDKAAQSTLQDVVSDCQELAALTAQLAERAVRFGALLQARVEAPEEE